MANFAGGVMASVFSSLATVAWGMGLLWVPIAVILLLAVVTIREFLPEQKRGKFLAAVWIVVAALVFLFIWGSINSLSKRASEGKIVADRTNVVQQARSIASNNSDHTSNNISTGSVFNNVIGSNGSYNQAGRDINIFESRDEVQREPAFKIHPPEKCEFFRVSAPSIDTNLNNRLGVMVAGVVIANNLKQPTTLREVVCTYGPKNDRKEISPMALPTQRLEYNDHPFIKMPVRSPTGGNDDFFEWSEIVGVLRDRTQIGPGGTWYISGTFVFGAEVQSSDDIMDPRIVVRDYLGHTEELELHPKTSDFLIRTTPMDQRGAPVALRNHNSATIPHVEPVFSPIEVQSGSAAWWLDDSNEVHWMTSLGASTTGTGLSSGDMCVKFDATSVNDIKLRIAAIRVEVIDFKKCNVFGARESGHTTARRYVAEIQPTNGTYFAKAATTNEDEYDFLSKNELEYFVVGIKSATSGLYHLRVWVDYVAGSEKIPIEVGDVPEVIGFYDKLASPAAGSKRWEAKK